MFTMIFLLKAVTNFDRKKFRFIILVTAFGAILASCKTTQPPDDFTPNFGAIDPHIRGIRRGKLTPLRDPNWCKLDEESKTNLSSQPIRINRGKVCILAFETSIEKSHEIADVSEIAYLKVKKYFSVKNQRRVTVIIQKEEKNKTARAKPLYGRIYIPHRLFDHWIDEGILIHEMTHALAGLSGPIVTSIDTIYYGRIPKRTLHLSTSGLLNEGLAQYLQLELAETDNLLKQRLNLHETAKKELIDEISDDYLEERHKYVNYFRDHSSNYLQKNRINNYIAAGSFVKYLIEKHGLPRFKYVYVGAEFVKTYDKYLSELQADWKEFLENGDNFKNNPISEGGEYDMSEMSDELVCNKMQSDKKFADMAIFRILNSEICDALRSN